MFWPKLNSTAKTFLVRNPETCSNKYWHSWSIAVTQSLQHKSSRGNHLRPKLEAHSLLSRNRESRTSFCRGKAFKAISQSLTTFILLCPVNGQGNRDTLRHVYLHSFVLHSLHACLLMWSLTNGIPESTFIKLSPIGVRSDFLPILLTCFHVNQSFHQHPRFSRCLLVKAWLCRNYHEAAESSQPWVDLGANQHMYLGTQLSLKLT